MIHIAHSTDPTIGDVLKEEWNELAAASTNPSVFNTYNYILNSWHAFESHSNSLHLLTARWNDKLVGLLPLRISKPDPANGELTTLSYAGSTGNDRPYLLARPQHETAIWDGFLHTIKTMDWDRLDFPRIPTKSPGRFALTLHFDALGMALVDSKPDNYWTQVNLSRPTPVPVPLHQHSTAAHVAQFLTPDFCRHYPDHLVDEFLTPNRIEEGLDIFIEIVSNSHIGNGWEFLGISPSIPHSQCESFFRRTVLDLCQDGYTGSRVLRSGRTILAANITHTFGDTSCIHATVAADEHQEYMPNEALNALLIERLRDQPPTSAVSTVANARQLKRWACGTTAAENVSVYRNDFRRSNPRPDLEAVDH